MLLTLQKFARPQGLAIVLPLAQLVAHLLSFCLFFFVSLGEKVARAPLLCQGYSLDLGIGERHGAHS